jgi:pyruvate,orthophosphate dikinase
LWLLQTRSGKRTVEAAIRIALDMLDEGLITREAAIERVPMGEFDRLVRPVIDPYYVADVVTTGLPASPGTMCGIVVFTPADAVALAASGKPAILVRNETSPDDVEGIDAAVALLTRRGGMTSHAAVVARAMGRPCVVGAMAIKIDFDERKMSVGERVIRAGEELTIDGSHGRVIAGRVPMCEPQLDAHTLRFKALVEAAGAPASKA